MIKYPTFWGEEEIHERERIKKKIISFAIVIKFQSNFIGGKERIYIICLLFHWQFGRENFSEAA